MLAIELERVQTLVLGATLVDLSDFFPKGEREREREATLQIFTYSVLKSKYTRIIFHSLFRNKLTNN